MENNASGEKPAADDVDDGSGDDVAMMARRREMLNLMIIDNVGIEILLPILSDE